jgi:hypothetical protein
MNDAKMTISRRFKEFRKLHETVKKIKQLLFIFQLLKKYEMLTFPAFPSGTLLRPNRVELEKRKLLFSEYFHFFLNDPGLAIDRDIRRFLSPWVCENINYFD